MIYEDTKDCSVDCGGGIKVDNVPKNLPKTGTMARPIVESINFKELPLVPFRSIKLGKLLGKGQFSNVYKIKYIDGKSSDMVIKRLTLEAAKRKSRRRAAGDDTTTTTITTANGDDKKNKKIYRTCSSDLINEGKILSLLSHDNVISIHGWSGTTLAAISSSSTTTMQILNLPYILLDPLVETLKERIIDWEKRKPKLFDVMKRKQIYNILLEEKCTAILALANAINYLHENAIVHRDLKPKNIGFDRNGILKVFDFDIAVIIPDTCDRFLFHLTKECGTPRYMAPEIGRGDPYNLLSDVYSFGLLVYEILSSKRPYQDYQSFQEMKKFVYNGNERPIVPKTWPTSLQDLLKKECWSRRIHKRSNMNNIQFVLETNIVPELLSSSSSSRPPSTTKTTSMTTKRNRKRTIANKTKNDAIVAQNLVVARSA